MNLGSVGVRDKYDQNRLCEPPKELIFKVEELPVMNPSPNHKAEKYVTQFTILNEVPLNKHLQIRKTA